MSSPSPSQATPGARSDIAVVGVSALFPGSIDADGFWRDILAGRDLIRDIPEEHWLVEDYYDPDPKAPDKTYARRGAFLDPIDFDALGFGIPPSNVPATDTSQLLALIVAERVLADASRASSVDRSRTSVILGVTSAQELLGQMVSRLQAPIWKKALREMGLSEPEVEDACQRIASHYVPWQEATFPGLLGNVVAGRIANRLDLGGTNCVTDAACASTFSAIQMAANELVLGQSDLAIAGGVDTMNDIFMFMCFSKTPALSPTGDCRPFSDAADGTMLGEGLAMFALKRRADAEAAGDRIYAILKGIGAGSDGRAKSVYAPLASGQARTLRRAYEAAGYGPETVELVEAHGTGTRAGDAAELAGLREVFAESANGRRGWCALGSVKSQIGHTKSAAGAAGLFKAVMALNEAVLPPSIKIDRPSPQLEIERSPFYLSTRALPWVRGREHPRRASVSSFGFGGSNFHITLEEPPRRAPRRNTLPMELVVVGGSTPEALACGLRDLAAEIAPGRLPYLARSSHRAYRDAPKSWRATFAVGDEESLARGIEEALGHLSGPAETFYRSPRGTFVGSGPEEGRIAFVFPGQGSQYVDMGRDLAIRFAAAREVWDRSADLALGDRPLHRVVFPETAFDPETKEVQQTELTRTEWAQPALGSTSLAQLAVLERAGVVPAMLGGHSFGELTALAAASALSVEELLRVARRRGELMAEAARTPGAMTAVSASLEQVRQVLATAEVSAEIANHNAPEQVVLAGPVGTIEAAEAALAKERLRYKRLPVATAFHSSVVASAKAPFREALGAVALDPPRIPVFANTTARPHSDAPEAICDALAEQLAYPVRFVEMIEAMYEHGARVFVEVGAGSVLTGLIQRILDKRPHRAVALDRKGKPGFETFLLGMAELLAAGAAVDPVSLFAEYDAPEDPAARPKPKIALAISGTNYGKPYPPAGDRPRARPAPGGSSVEPHPARRQGAPSKEAASSKAPGASEKIPVRAAAHIAGARLDGGASTAAPKLNGLRAALPHPVSAGAAPMSPGASTYGSPSAASPASGRPSSGSTPPGARPASPSSWVREEPPASRFSPTLVATNGAPMPAKAPTPAPASPMSRPAPRMDGAPSPWLSAWQSAQVEAAAAHAAYQQAMASTHSAYLALAESSLTALTQLAGGEPQAHRGVTPEARLFAPGAHHPVQPVPGSGAGTAPMAHLPPVAQRTGAPLEAAPPNDPELTGRARAREEAARSLPPAPPLPATSPAPSWPAPSVAPPAPATEPSSATLDLQSKLRSVVAAATGYPEEVLERGMSLEADLGIDSIKRVEILSLVKKAVPGLPELDAAALGALETLGDVADHLQGALGGPTGGSSTHSYSGNGPQRAGRAWSPAAGGPSVAPLAKPAGTTALAPEVRVHRDPSTPKGEDVEARLRSVVAEATGYPEEVLEPTMSLEADLGIDSIKRVEILSLVKKAVPGLPELDAAALGALETLGDVAQHLRQALGASPGSGSEPAVSNGSNGHGRNLDGAAVEAKLRSVVAEATGYPEEVLERAMSLEADLGIDSIKRVEILSLVKKAVPGLPELDAAALGALETLGDVADHLRSALEGGAPLARPSSGRAEGGTPSPDLEEEPAEGLATSPAAARATEHRFVPELVDAPASGLARARPDRLRSVAVIAGPEALSAAVTDAMRAAGFSARATDAVTADDDGVVLLHGLEPVDGPRDAMGRLKDAFRAVRASGALLAGEGGLLIAALATGGGLGLDPPPSAARAPFFGLSGLIKTAALEAPGLPAAVVDLDIADLEPAVVAERLVKEILGGGLERDVAYDRAGRRRTVVAVPRPHETQGLGPEAGDAARIEMRAPATVPFEPGDVIVATGGGRGVTARCLRALADSVPARFVLLGRTPLEDEPDTVTHAETEADLKRALVEAKKARGEKVEPAELGREAARILAAREIRDTLEALHRAGAEARYLPIDVSDPSAPEALSAALAEVRASLGPIAGIVHAAGVIQDKRILDKTDEQVDRVLATKLGGLIALLEATEGDPLKAVVLFSSVAAHSGNVGQADYAMANAALDAFASGEAARRERARVKSLAWGPWRGGMVSPALEARFEAAGVPLIELDDGARWMVEELRTPGEPRVIFGGAPDAGPLLPDGGSRPARLEARVDGEHHPELADHAIDGRPVVPMALAADLLLGALSGLEPRAKVLVLESLHVLRGVVLEEWPAAVGLAVTATRAAGAYSLALVDGSGRPRYTATGRVSALPSIPNRPEGLPAAADPAPYGKAKVLFHGPRFQMLSPLEAYGPDGARGRLLDAPRLGWVARPWRLDPARLDGVLQLALLAAESMTDSAGLPTRIGRLFVDRTARAAGPGEAWAITRERSTDQHVFDGVALDGEGRPALVLEGLETTRRPGRKQDR